MAERQGGLLRLLIRLERLTWVSLAGIGLGLSVLLVYSWIEYLNNPGITLVDGYWIGRVPWIPLGVVLVLAGSAVALVASSLAILLRGDWVRRLLVPAILALPVLWWLVAVGVLPFARFLPPDPVTLAYSWPEAAVIALILPAVAAAVLSLLPIRSDRKVRLRKVHDQSTR